LEMSCKKRGKNLTRVGGGRGYRGKREVGCYRFGTKELVSQGNKRGCQGKREIAGIATNLIAFNIRTGRVFCYILMGTVKR